jgi:hypothetical protein
MNEDVDVSAGSGAGFVKEFDTGGFEAFDSGVEVGDFHGYVVETGASFVDEFGDSAFGGEGFE